MPGRGTLTEALAHRLRGAPTRLCEQRGPDQGSRLASGQPAPPKSVNARLFESRFRVLLRPCVAAKDE
jgi:hypothetical protein